MTYEQKLVHTMSSPTSRVTGAFIEFDEQLGWNKTHYTMLLSGRAARPMRALVVMVKTLSMMVVEKC